MAKIEHTPGPWVVRQTRFPGCGPLRHAILAGPSAYCVATVDGNEANARLIAAAPDRLVALRDAEVALEVHGAFGTLAIVRAAIAKAEPASAPRSSGFPADWDLRGERNLGHQPGD